MKNEPLVSICIPTFNRARMVGKAIESALNQTYTHIEVIIVDNASTDTIEDVVASFPDTRVKFFKNEKNLGLFGNFNRCIDLAHGEYIHILHSDDYINENFTETCVSFLESHPDVWLTCTSQRAVSADTIQEYNYSENNIVFEAPEGFKRLLSERSFISCPSVMVRRGLYEQTGVFSLEYPYSGDYYQWLKVAREFSIAYISNAWVYYRRGEHSESYRLLFRSPLGYLDTLKIYARLIEELGTQAEEFAGEINIALRRFIRDCIYAGFRRSDMMHNFRPSVFAGIATGAWSLQMRGSWKEGSIKAAYLFLILISGSLMLFSGTRRAVRALLERKQEDY
ncbi:MAG: hypothetical protein APR53_03295 [Methanoculleus sp. SDB]|nr:MAG: hypothetical protein APR53_03295 [Methanoculleus sp. SDB]